MCLDEITGKKILQTQLNDCLEKLKVANDTIYQLSKTDDGKAQKILEQQNQIATLQIQTMELNSNIESLKTTLALTGDVTTICPEFIDVNRDPYLPYRQIITPEGSISGFRIPDPREMFVLCAYQKDIVKQNNWRGLSKYQKAMKAWGIVANKNNETYIADHGDNWQISFETHYRKGGDCEDKSTEFVTFCRALGIPATDVFLVVGPTSFGYHAYPIIKFTDVEAQEFGGVAGNYIFEATLDFTPDKPRPIIGSPYWIDNGAMNWEHCGQIKPEFLTQFNGVPGALTGAQEIDHSKEKNQMIKEYWLKR